MRGHARAVADVAREPGDDVVAALARGAEATTSRRAQVDELVARRRTVAHGRARRRPRRQVRAAWIRAARRSARSPHDGGAGGPQPTTWPSGSPRAAGPSTARGAPPRGVAAARGAPAAAAAQPPGGGRRRRRRRRRRGPGSWSTRSSRQRARRERRVGRQGRACSTSPRRAAARGGAFPSAGENNPRDTGAAAETRARMRRPRWASARPRRRRCRPRPPVRAPPPRAPRSTPRRRRRPATWRVLNGVGRSARRRAPRRTRRRPGGFQRRADGSMARGVG